MLHNHPQMIKWVLALLPVGFIFADHCHLVAQRMRLEAAVVMVYFSSVLLRVFQDEMGLR